MPAVPVRGIFDLPLLGHLLAKPERVKHGDSKIVPFAPKQLFDVVSDVERYREFLPFCVDSRINRRVNNRTFEADLKVGFRIFTETYTSMVELDPARAVNVRCIRSNVFSYLVSKWSFTPIDAANTRIEFSVEFEVSSPVHAQAVNLFFGQVAQKQMKAFEQRCFSLYSPLKKLEDTSKTAQRLQQQQQQQQIPTTAAKKQIDPTSSQAAISSAKPTSTSAPSSAKTAPASTDSASRLSAKLGHVIEHRHGSGADRATLLPPASVEHDDWFTAQELSALKAVFQRHATRQGRLTYEGFLALCSEVQTKNVLFTRFRDR